MQSDPSMPECCSMTLRCRWYRQIFSTPRILLQWKEGAKTLYTSCNKIGAHLTTHKVSFTQTGT